MGLRIAQVAAFPFPSPQGSQVYVQGIARGLAARGHDVRLLCYAHGRGVEDTGYQIIRTPSIPGYNNMRAGPDWVKPFLDAALAVLVARQKVDILHVHNYEAPLSARLGRFGRKIPMVYSAHNVMSEELHLYFSGRWAQKAAGLAGRILDRTVPKMADHAIAIRPESIPVLEQLGCSQVSCVPPGVAMSDFNGTKQVELGEGPWVIYAGNPDNYQNLDVLMKAMRLIPQIKLLMVSAASLEQWKGIDNVHCVETSDFEMVCAYMRAADIAVLPRVSCSGFPMKILNYLALGLPVVAAQGSAVDIPGVVSVPNYDALSLAACIKNILSDREEMKILGLAGQEAVQTNYSWDVQCEKLERVYYNLLSNLH